MPLIRVTQETAVETVQQLIGEFLEAVRSAGRDPALGKLEERAAELDELVESGSLEVELLAIGRASCRERV